MWALRDGYTSGKAGERVFRHEERRRSVSVLIDCLAVGAGGFIGSVARYLVGLLPAALGARSVLGGFPVATFSINVVGAFAIGFIAAWATRR